MTEESANENFLLKSLHKQKNALTLHPHLKKCSWCGSSAWLEYMPVTHGVAGSSPVRTATNAKILTVLAFFIAYLLATTVWNVLEAMQSKE